MAATTGDLMGVWAGADRPDIVVDNQEVDDMRGLFHVVVVDYKRSEVLADRLVVAESAERAKMKAAALFVDKLDDLDVVCNKLGDVRGHRAGAEK